MATIKSRIQDIKEGDQFYAFGTLRTASEDAHQDLDEPDKLWLVYDEEGEGYFEEDIDSEAPAMKNGRMSMAYDGKAANELTKDELILAIFHDRDVPFEEDHIWAMGEAYRCGFLAGEAFAYSMTATKKQSNKKERKTNNV